MSRISRVEIEGRIANGGLNQLSLVRADLSAMALARIDLSGANLRMVNAHGSDLTEAKLGRSSLSGANLSDAVLVGANLVEASVIGGLLSGADLSRADLSGADLTGATIESSQLQGAYLVGTFLNAANLSRSNLSAAYIRMAQMAGSNLTAAVLECADLSDADLTGTILDGASFVRAKLANANLAASSMVGCDLRGADLTGADLTGCNLTGAKVHGVKFTGIKLDDSWAEWVDVGSNTESQRSTLEEFFEGIVGCPTAQMLVQGRVDDEAWSVILNHLRCFQVTNPDHADVRLKAIHQGVSGSALYLEASSEESLAAYLIELAEIIGKGAQELFEQLGTLTQHRGRVEAAVAAFSGSAEVEDIVPANFDLEPILNSAVDSLQENPIWNSEKAIAIFSANRRIWLEATSSETLTLRPPHGSALGVNLVRGRFVDRR